MEPATQAAAAIFSLFLLPPQMPEPTAGGAG